MQPYLDTSYSSLIDDLSNRAQLKRAETANGALRYLETHNPHTILVTDEYVADKDNKAVLDKLVSYVHAGGRVIIGLHFPTFVDVDDFNSLFGKEFGLTWTRESYHRATFQLILPAFFPTTMQGPPCQSPSA